MGNALSATLRQFGRQFIALIFVALLLISKITAAAQEITITPTLNFSPGDGLFLHYDKDRSYFSFQRVTSCSQNQNNEFGDVLCRLYLKDTYFIEPFTNTISFINSKEIRHKDLLSIGAESEDKLIDIIKSIEKSESNEWKKYETIIIERNIFAEIYYIINALNSKGKIRFMDQHGHTLYEEHIGLSIINDPIIITREEHSEQIILMLDIISCISSCQGQIRFYQINNYD